MTSAFVIQVQSELQQDPNDETAALLRVLIYKIDNTTFGGDVPALPQWSGPPRTVIQVQSILYASLTASLLSAFLAMLGKQWLNRYASVDMRGSAIERSQNRQRKSDGIVAWYFDHVMESLPLMLQLALLLLGCALSLYLWEINTTVASVVIGVTSFGVLIYTFVLIAGAISENCPYQTPWTNGIRRAFGVPRLAYELFAKHSLVHRTSVNLWHFTSPSSAVQVVAVVTLIYPLPLLLAFLCDALQFGPATFRTLVVFARGARRLLVSTPPAPKNAFTSRVIELDIRCLLWMLQTSLDKTINFLTLNFLGIILPSSGLDLPTNSALVVSCFNILASCFVTGKSRVTMITRGSEQLAEKSVICFLHAFSHLLTAEPKSAVIRDVRHRYWAAFPFGGRWWDPQCPLIVNVIHHLYAASLEPPFIDWRSYNPSTDDLVPIAHALAQVARFEYNNSREREEHVPDWLIRFALRFLSQDPLPPISVVIDCLTIVATDLGRDVSDINSAGLDEKCVHTPKTTGSPLTLRQYTARRPFQLDN